MLVTILLIIWLIGFIINFQWTNPNRGMPLLPAIFWPFVWGLFGLFILAGGFNDGY